MNLRCLGTHASAVPVLLVLMTPASHAQVSTSAQTSSATRVSAEMTKGKLSPADSKTGDTVTVRLSDDLKSNGRIILKKGTVITGVVHKVSHNDPKTHVPSMIELEWIVPTEGRAVQSVTVALQSVTQLSAADLADLDDETDELPGQITTAGASLPAAAGMLANPALLSMPSVVALDHQTTSVIESNLDSSASGPLFKVGHGELAAAGGVHESVELFSHLTNDTVISSPSRNFEIFSGAQMQLLVGIRR